MRFKQFITESIHDKGILKLLMVGGLSASGKSTILSKILDGTIPIKGINTDKFVEIYDPKNQHWATMGKKFKSLTNKSLILHLNSLLPIYIDSTSSNISLLKKRVESLRDIGYDTKFLFIKTSKRTSIKRSIQRDKGGDRHVDIDFIKDTFDKFYCQGEYKDTDCSSAIGEYKKIFGDIDIIDNNDNMVTNKMIIKIYNNMNKYLLSPVKNKKGKKLLDFMKNNGYIYYNEIPEEWKNDNGYPLLKNINYY